MEVQTRQGDCLFPDLPNKVRQAVGKSNTIQLGFGEHFFAISQMPGALDLDTHPIRNI